VSDWDMHYQKVAKAQIGQRPIQRKLV